MPDEGVIGDPSVHRAIFFIFRVLWVAVSSAYFVECVRSPEEFHFIDYTNLIVHEAGHLIFSFTGDFLHSAMGPGIQVLLPLCIALYVLAHKQPFAGAFCLMWFGESMTNVSVYAGDAIAMQLPLLGGSEVTHDWNYLLTSTHMLADTVSIAHTLYMIGICGVLSGIAVGTAALLSEQPIPTHPVEFDI